MAMVTAHGCRELRGLAVDEGGALAEVVLVTNMTIKSN